MTVYTATSGLLGGTGDIMLEVGTEQLAGASAPQCSVVYVVGPAVRFDFTVAGADAHIATGVDTANGYVVYLDLYAQTLGSETSVFSRVSSGTRPLRLRPDGRLAVYDETGNLLGLSASSAAGVWRKVVLVEDATGQQRTVHLFIDGVEELATTSANPLLGNMTATRSLDGWGWGDTLASGESTGTVYLMRNALLRSFTEESESPRLVQWPALRAAPRRIPTAEGVVASWADGTTASPNTWQDVAEFPNDGDTSYIADTTSPGGDFHFFVSGDPNPLPAGANVLGVQVSCSTKVAQSGKSFGSAAINIYGGQATSSGAPGGTAWTGYAWLFPARPDGSPWERGDFEPNALNFGVQSGTSDPPNSRCSNICYQVVYWTDLLPLATTPWQPPPSAGRARAQVVIV